MPEIKLNLGSQVAIRKPVFDQLLGNLAKAGYETIGPHIKDAALIYAPISGLADLPQGFTSEQDGGHYRLKASGNSRYFDLTPGAPSWKQFLFPPRTELFNLMKENGNWLEEALKKEPPRYAFIGVRPCELAAIAVQDKVFIRSDFTDPTYKSRRENIFILAVDCLHPGDTCFCASMGTGPAAEGGFDLKLIELDEVFLIEVGSQAGLDVLHDLSVETIGADWQQAAAERHKIAVRSMGRHLDDVASVPGVLINNLEHPRWKDVAARCLSCTSCTQVCPTCFCWDVEDTTSLDGKNTARIRVWDSCFNITHAAQAGGNIRPTTASRYRQWLTHKMSTWQQQFGVLGCVGCGRCITWCPAGIDITEEIKAIRGEAVK
ncbi:MAG: 4Fe-4S dicluster domain-containing protein [Anaerolineales bacterium]